MKDIPLLKGYKTTDQTPYIVYRSDNKYNRDDTLSKMTFLLKSQSESQVTLEASHFNHVTSLHSYQGRVKTDSEKNCSERRIRKTSETCVLSE